MFTVLSRKLHRPAMPRLRHPRPPPAGKVNAKEQRGRMQQTILSHDAVGVPLTQARTPPELSIVVPTLNENGNVPLLVLQLGRALDGIGWEVIFVDDDSADGTIARRRAGWPGAIPGSAVFAASAAAAWRAPASRGCSHPRRRPSPSWMRICSTMKSA